MNRAFGGLAEPNELRYIQAFCGCSIAEIDLTFMSPTLNFEVSQIGQLPINQDEAPEPTVCSLVLKANLNNVIHALGGLYVMGQCFPDQFGAAAVESVLPSSLFEFISK